MTTNLPDLLRRYPGGESALRAAMATQGRPVSRQLMRLWFTGTVPSPGYLADLARLLIPVGVPALDLYTAAGVPLPRDVFPGVHGTTQDRRVVPERRSSTVPVPTKKEW